MGVAPILSQFNCPWRKCPAGAFLTTDEKISNESGKKDTPLAQLLKKKKKKKSAIYNKFVTMKKFDRVSMAWKNLIIFIF